MAKVYKNDVGTIVKIDLQTDLSSATSITINVKKPDGTSEVWNPTVYETVYLRYVIQSGDLNLSGTYTLQVHLTDSGWTGSSTPCKFTVHSLI